MSRVELDIANPAEWLVQFDRTPAIIPQWPGNDYSALVVVLEEPDSGDEVGYVLTSQADLPPFLQVDRDYPALFYKVPRRVLLDNKICPGLNLESWR